MRRTIFFVAFFEFAICAAILAGAAGAQQPTTSDVPVVRDPSVLTSPHSNPSRDWLVSFDGGLMSPQRAQKLAERAGYELIGYIPCTDKIADCAILEVKGPAGRVYQYQILAKSCHKLVKRDVTAPIRRFDEAPAAQKKTGSPDASRRRTAGSIQRPDNFATEPPSPNPTAALDTGDDGYVDGCFAGYEVAFRARQLDSLWVAAEGFIVSLEQRYQVWRDGRWVPILHVLASNWAYGEQSGGEQSGWAYEVRDGADAVVASDSRSVFAIASSGAATPAPEALCAAERDKIVARQQSIVSIVYTVLNFFTADSLGGQLGLEPLGVGVTGSLAKNVDLPENLKEVGDDHAAVVGTSFYADCLQHPGRYFPNLFPPTSGALGLDGLPQFRPPVAAAINYGSMATCPIHMLMAETADMGDGVTCTANVRRTCTTTASGDCYCDRPEIVGDTVCTETNPTPAPPK